jgi:hypothetical protein
MILVDFCPLLPRTTRDGAGLVSSRANGVRGDRVIPGFLKSLHVKLHFGIKLKLD